MRRTVSDTGSGNKLDCLKATLGAARDVIEELSGNTLLARWIDAFFAMPAEDRQVIVDAVDRDVKARVLSKATESVTGQVARPNPNARVYVRAHGAEAQRSDLEQEEMMLATIRAMRVARFLAIPEIHTAWRAATAEALEQIDAETRAVVAQLVDEVREMLSALDPPASAASGGERS